MKGKNVTKAWGVKYRSIRQFKPNLRSVSLVIDGSKRRVKVCAKCLKKHNSSS